MWSQLLMVYFIFNCPKVFVDGNWQTISFMWHTSETACSLANKSYLIGNMYQQLIGSLLIYNSQTLLSCSFVRNGGPKELSVQVWNKDCISIDGKLCMYKPGLMKRFFLRSKSTRTISAYPCCGSIVYKLSILCK